MCKPATGRCDFGVRSPCWFLHLTPIHQCTISNTADGCSVIELGEVPNIKIHAHTGWAENRDDRMNGCPGRGRSQRIKRTVAVEQPTCSFFCGRSTFYFALSLSLFSFSNFHFHFHPPFPSNPNPHTLLLTMASASTPKYAAKSTIRSLYVHTSHHTRVLYFVAPPFASITHLELDKNPGSA